mmetsp:Transcript_27989/g.42872  ORF Transcript_27989/g.42872 Transcript_27989/m.42872 type:complete len:207 (-) Transcript_27989:10-630(-)
MSPSRHVILTTLFSIIITCEGFSVLPTKQTATMKRQNDLKHHNHFLCSPRKGIHASLYFGVQVLLRAVPTADNSINHHNNNNNNNNDTFMLWNDDNEDDFLTTTSSPPNVNTSSSSLSSSSLFFGSVMLEDDDAENSVVLSSSLSTSNRTHRRTTSESSVDSTYTTTSSLSSASSIIPQTSPLRPSRKHTRKPFGDISNVVLTRTT